MLMFPKSWTSPRNINIELMHVLDVFSTTKMYSCMHTQGYRKVKIFIFSLHGHFKDTF